MDTIFSHISEDTDYNKFEFFSLFFESLSFPQSLEFVSKFHLEDFTYLSGDLNCPIMF